MNPGRNGCSAGAGWLPMHFMGGPLDGLQVRFRPNAPGHLPAATFLVRDPSRVESPLAAGELLHCYRLEPGPRRLLYRHAGKRRLP